MPKEMGSIGKTCAQNADLHEAGMYHGIRGIGRQWGKHAGKRARPQGRMYYGIIEIGRKFRKSVRIKTSTTESWNVSSIQQHNPKVGARPKAGMSFRISKNPATCNRRNTWFLCRKVREIDRKPHDFLRCPIPGGEKATSVACGSRTETPPGAAQAAGEIRPSRFSGTLAARERRCLLRSSFTRGCRRGRIPCRPKFETRNSKFEIDLRISSFGFRVIPARRQGWDYSEVRSSRFSAG